MQQLALDACVVINLWAGDVLRSLASVAELHVVDQVAREAHFVLSDDAPQAIPLTGLVADGTLTPARLASEELPAYLSHVPALGDGEAASLALASSRGLTLATDDRSALRRARASAEPVDTVTTPDLLSWWADAVRANDADLAGGMRRIERFACYAPPASHPLATWWRDLVDNR